MPRPNYGRDLDIGVPDMNPDTQVANFAEVTVKIQEEITQLGEATLELKKARFGTGLITGVDLNDEEVD